MTLSEASHPMEGVPKRKKKTGPRDAVIVYNSGDTYEGFVDKGRNREGYGVMKWMDGSVFEGFWKDDKQVQGTLVWKDKSYYEGEFHGDFFNGEGVLVTKQEIIRGTWKKSKLEGQGERILLEDNSK